MIDYAGSQGYFAGHVKEAIWTQFGEPACVAAIAQARRTLARAIGRAMDDAEATYAEGDQTRDEYAVYEQALYLLENSAIANGQGSAPAAMLVGASEAPDTPRKAERAVYAPEALRWLGYRGAVTVSG